MLVGQSCRWWLPEALLWPRDQRSQLRQNHAGQADRPSRGLQDRHEHPREDHAAVDHDRSEAGLRDCRAHGGGDRNNQRGQSAVTGSIPDFLLGKLFGLLIPGSGNRRINWNRNPPENRIIPSFVSQLSLPILWIAALLLLFPLKDSRPGITQDAYDRAWKLFQHGRLADSQREAEESYRRFRISDPALAAKFQLLEAEAMVWRGLYEDALRILATHSTLGDPEETIRKL